MKLVTPRRRGAPPSEQPPPPSQIYTFSAPVRGWVTNESIAAAEPRGASVLDNFWVERTAIKPRGGRRLHATVHASNPCESLMVYRSGTAEKLFGCTAAAIYDISSPADATVVPSSAVSGLTGGDWSYVQMATAGGEFLIAANGADSMRKYDGSAWGTITGVTTPAITGVTTSDIKHVWVYKNRLFMIKKDTLNAYALDTPDAFGGAVDTISLQGVFQKGGELVLGATWSTDSGSGMDDMCVFISDQGEVAVYTGTDPGDATAWSLMGVYQMAPPIHKNAIMKAGGNLLVATKIGLIPVSSAVRKDYAAQVADAVSIAIEPTWQRYYKLRPGKWVIGKSEVRGKAIIGFPTDAGGNDACFAVNLQTGGWSRFTNWDVRCAAEFDGELYFGTSDGMVMEAETVGTDNGETYSCLYVGNYERLGGTNEKVAHMCKTTWRASTNFNYKINFAFDYAYKPSAYPSVGEDAATDLWDVGLWDVAVWDASGTEQITTEWQSVNGRGFAVAPMLQTTMGTGTVPDIEFISADLLYETGALVT